MNFFVMNFFFHNCYQFFFHFNIIFFLTIFLSIFFFNVMFIIMIAWKKVSVDAITTHAVPWWRTCVRLRSPPPRRCTRRSRGSEARCCWCPSPRRWRAPRCAASCRRDNTTRRPSRPRAACTTPETCRAGHRAWSDPTPTWCWTGRTAAPRLCADAQKVVPHRQRPCAAANTLRDTHGGRQVRRKLLLYGNGIKYHRQQYLV